jgi:hypothetical protein
MKPAPLIIGIAALGGLGYYLTTQSATAGGTLSGGTDPALVTPGGITTPSSGGSTTTTAETETIEKKWKKRGSLSKSYNRSTCTLNGFKAKAYTESTQYAPSETINIAILAKYFETSGSEDWWGYCGGTKVPKSWYGNDEVVYTGITITSDEDPSSVTTVQNYGTYPQSPDATGGSSLVPSGDLSQSVLDACQCREESSSAKDDWGLAVYSTTAPATPGRYTVKVKMGLSNPSYGFCSAQSRDFTFSIMIKQGTVLEAESTTANRFRPISTYQSNHMW